MSIRTRFQTIEFGEIDIHVRTLRDNQQYEDINQIAEKLGISSATWPLFGVIWPSSLELAKFMSNFDINDKRILEVGCGIGLASLLLNHMKANISATDIHPCAIDFLRENSALNNDRIIPFERMDWDKANKKLGKFDVIIGSDLLYEQNHAKLLSDFIDNHANATCEIIIVDPNRGHLAKFIKMMVLMGYSIIECDDALESYDMSFKHSLIKFKRVAQ